MSIQSQMWSSIMPICSIFCFMTFLQQMYLGFSSKLRFLVYLNIISSYGQPSKRTYSDISCFIFKTRRILSPSDFLMLLATSDHGSDPFAIQRSMYIKDYISSLRLIASPRLYLMLENYKLMIRGSDRFSSLICSKVCASLNREAPPQSTINSLPCFSPGPSKKFRGISWLCTKFLKWKYCKMAMIYCPSMRTVFSENLPLQSLSNTSRLRSSSSRTMKLQSSYWPHQCIWGIPIPPCMTWSIFPSWRMVMKLSLALHLYSSPFMNNGSLVWVWMPLQSKCQ